MGGEEGNGKEGRCGLCPVAKIPAGAHFSSSYDEDCLSRHLFEVMECYSIYIYIWSAKVILVLTPMPHRTYITDE